MPLLPRTWWHYWWCKFPKANEAQPLSTIPVKARCSRPRCFVVYNKLLLITLRIWEAMNVCPVLADSVEISNVSNIVQSRCIKCDWCGLLLKTSVIIYSFMCCCYDADPLIFIHILYINIKIHKVRYGSIWPFYHVVFVHCCPIWKSRRSNWSSNFGIWRPTNINQWPGWISMPWASRPLKSYAARWWLLFWVFVQASWWHSWFPFAFS